MLAAAELLLKYMSKLAMPKNPLLEFRVSAQSDSHSYCACVTRDHFQHRVITLAVMSLYLLTHPVLTYLHSPSLHFTAQ